MFVTKKLVDKLWDIVNVMHIIILNKKHFKNFFWDQYACIHVIIASAEMEMTQNKLAQSIKKEA